MEKNLESICQFYSGTGFPIAFQGNPDGELPFYKVGDISNNVLSGNDRLKYCSNYIPRDMVSELRGTIIPKDTVVFAKIGEALKLNRRAITDTDCLVDNNVMGIKPNPDILRIGYFFYYMKQLKLQNYSESTTVPSVRKSILEKIRISVPSLEEQFRIEQKLDIVNYVIQKLRQELSVLDEFIKALFVEMFGLPGTDIYGWGLTPLGDCSEINPKKSADDRLVSDLEVSFIPMPAVSEDGAIDTSMTKVYDEVRSGFTYFTDNDVLFAKITPCMENGKGAVAVGLRNGIGFGSTEFHVLRPLEGKSNPFWIYYLTSFDSFRKDAAANMTGSAGQRRVPASFLERYKVSLPPIELQNQFAIIVDQVVKSKAAVQKALGETQLLFDSLMQQHFG